MQQGFQVWELRFSGESKGENAKANLMDNADGSIQGLVSGG